MLEIILNEVYEIFYWNIFLFFVYLSTSLIFCITKQLYAKNNVNRNIGTNANFFMENVFCEQNNSLNLSIMLFSRMEHSLLKTEGRAIL